MKQYLTHSAEETEKLAAKFSKQLKPNDVIAFEGGMGMGKTAFTRGLVRGLGGSDIVSSPTFALVNEYPDGRMTVYHFDMYRVTSWDDLYSTGFFDYLDTGAVLVIEWSENIAGALPENTIYVSISPGNSETERLITIDSEETSGMQKGLI